LYGTVVFGKSKQPLYDFRWTTNSKGVQIFNYLPHIVIGVWHYYSQTFVVDSKNLAWHNEYSEALLCLVFPWVLEVVAEVPIHQCHTGQETEKDQHQN